MKAITLLSILFLCFGGYAWSPEYSIEGTDIKVELRECGTMAVKEKRKYHFEGEFSYVHRSLPIEEDLAFSNYRVMVEGEELTEDDSEEPGSMKVEREDGQYILTGFIDAKETRKNITFAFEVNGALKEG